MIKVTISVVSHLQLALVRSLLLDLSRQAFPNDTLVNVVVTLNMPEVFCARDFPNLDIKVIENVRPKGFGDNHNSAFSVFKDSDVFIVVNPDIAINSFDWKTFIGMFNGTVAAAAPKILNKDGLTFPTTDLSMRLISYYATCLAYSTGGI